MIKPIITDKEFLSKLCNKVEGEYSIAKVTEDLLDTANSVYKKCAGLAAPQIGYSTRIIVVKLQAGFEVMVNPEFIDKSGNLAIGMEGCLSRPMTVINPVRVRRYYRVKIKYTNYDGVEVTKKFRNFEARVVQHEMDHLDGILI